MNTQMKILFGFILSMSLAACGGGSNSIDDTNSATSSGANSSTDNNTSNPDDGMSAGSGGCVTFSRPSVGQIVKRELKQVGEDIGISKETEIMEISPTSITQKILPNGVLLGSTVVENFTINNNFRDITSESTKISSFTFNTTYSPFQRVMIDEVCEGQTWTTVYTEIKEGEPAISHSKTYIIEAINVSKTTAAGTFNTFRVKIEDIDVVGTAWFDIASGYDVLSEFTDLSGNMGFTLELTEKNF